ncbi:alpha/beta fold hydrolase [Sphingomonas xinjiangensis]|uniref:Pimeloyl-ACP methyl ester carboxylesterase n=1 Tax=Sphingomonas xinjiangensis TaxID=643568 RepID=A0A840YJH5_9SPHN|nr:alpha/beta fold hydrolase [Sphingomonas xinjiangensis]MBB5708930.1 pimeloyl-ACP methyl ester carboxylesterase [Sphingomonas xinjiangensis]
MADFPIKTHRFTSFDGFDLAWHEVGHAAGRPIVLIHGYFSTAYVNWIKYGHAALLADAGFRVILPDLRAHGESAKPHDPAAYPPDVLMHDGLALIRHLGLIDYDLGGYSLGARTVVRMLANGASPRRAALCGMGLSGLLATEGRGAYFRRVLTNLGSFERGSTEWMTEAFLKTTKGDPEALLLILGTFVDTPQERIAAIPQPAIVVAGAEDFDNGSAQDVADLLPHGHFVEIPGNHMSAVSRPELGRAILDFFAAA